METTADTRDHPPGFSPGAWAWIQASLAETTFITEHSKTWNGLYVAPCPCGQLAVWDAYNVRVHHCPCSP